MNKDSFISFYAIQSQDGKWFKSKGYNNEHNKSWVDTLEKAKIYSKIGPARSQVTYWAKNFPDFGIPKLIELQVQNLVELNETERVTKSIDNIKKKEEKEKLRWEKYNFEKAKKDYEDAKKKLEEF